MNPDEKAKDIIKKHLNYFDSSKDEIAEEKAKNSAIITVNEIIEDIRSYRFGNMLTVNQQLEASSYWELVKNEILIS